MNATRLKLGAVLLLGLSAPAWWTWAVNATAHGVYIASGSPAQPTRLLLWASVYAPSLVLGFVAGWLASLLSAAAPLRGWLVFIAALVVGTAILAVLQGASPAEYLESLYASVGNWLFLVGSAVWPAIAYGRKRAV